MANCQLIGGGIDSFADNPTIDFLIVTDCLPSDTAYAPNITVLNMSWEQIQNKIRVAFNKLGFKHVCVSFPYKLCDYKPTFGYLFQDAIQGYDFWGYIDCDLVFGNLAKFLQKIGLSDYDRVYRAGHLSIFRNNEIINRLFLKEIPGCVRFSDVVGTTMIRNYDELGINEYFNKLGLRFYNHSEDATFGIYNYEFRWMNQNRPDLGEIFVKTEDGSTVVYRETSIGEILCTEVNYIHFMTKKDIHIPHDCPRPYCIMRNGVVPFDYQNIRRLLSESTSPREIENKFKNWQIQEFRKATVKKVIRELQFNKFRAIPIFMGRFNSWFKFLKFTINK